MKKIYLSIMLLVFVANTFAQQIASTNPDDMKEIATATPKNIIDNSVLSVQYRMTSIDNPQKPSEKKENYMLLQIGKKVSKFFDYFTLMSDSIRDSYAENKKSEIETMNKTLPVLKGTIPLNIIKNYPENNITVIDRVPLRGTFKYTEPKTMPKWNLVSGSENICGYDCKKATTTFRGRNYTAWYAPEIAINEGPWKFWGLPGLILKIEDDKQNYVFECVAIEKTKKYTPIYIKKLGYIHTTKEKLDKALRAHYANPAASIANSGLVTTPLPKSVSKARPYNPIELSD